MELGVYEMDKLLEDINLLRQIRLRNIHICINVILIKGVSMKEYTQRFIVLL